MRLLVVFFTLAMLTAASAQPQPLPKTVNIVNKATKEVIGTATFSDTRIYLRNKAGEHYATIEHNKDGTRTFYDASGRVIESPTVPVPDLPK